MTEKLGDKFDNNNSNDNNNNNNNNFSVLSLGTLAIIMSQVEVCFLRYVYFYYY